MALAEERIANIKATTKADREWMSTNWGISFAEEKPIPQVEDLQSYFDGGVVDSVAKVAAQIPQVADSLAAGGLLLGN